jgi:DNA-binding GntR family transcriptional regulator
VSAESVYERLRAEILAGRMQPNERLVEQDLAAAYSAGRAAVRTALVRLAQDGLVEHVRNRGARVRLVGEREAAEILEARMVLEGLAARSAAERATPGDIDALRGILARLRERLDAGDLLGASDHNALLHARILEIADHATVNRLVAALNSQLVRFQYRTILVPGRPGRSFAEHTAIVDAIAAGDPDAAERAMRTHLGHVTEAMRESSGQRTSASTAADPSPTAS